MKSLRTYRQALELLTKPRYAWFFIFPFALMALIFVVGNSVASALTNQIMALAEQILPHDSAEASWISSIAYWMIWVVIRLLIYLLLVFTGGSVVVILLTPVLAWLASAIIARHPNAPPQPGFLPSLWRSLRVNISVLSVQIITSLVLLILGMIPVVGIAAPFLLVAANAFFYGIGFLDYGIENLDWKSTKEFYRKNWMLAFGIGLPYAMWLAIPLIGPLTAGFASIVSTAAGTLSGIECGPAAAHQSRLGSE